MMSETNLNELGIHELCELIRRRDVTAFEIVNSCFGQIKKTQGLTNAFVIFNEEKSIERAQALDDQAANGVIAGPLHGIPVAVKDNYLTNDFPTTACSKVHQGKPIGVDATAVSNLRNAGAIIVGKTNMHEWAYGATNEFSANGPTRNPWNKDHITGGSSGGSGAALAARMVPAALGSDTGGSVRIPAAGCGVCGLKPTYGRVSRFGVLPLSWSLDVAGPMARSALDLEILFNCLSGKDSKDPATISVRRGSHPNSNDDSKRSIAVLRGKGIACDEEVEKMVGEALDCFVDLGYDVSHIEMPGLMTGFSAWKVILHAEAATYHERFLAEDAEKYSDNVRVQLEAGRCISAASYLKAQQYRAVFNRDLHAIFNRFDAVVTPTIPVTAPQIGHREVLVGNSKMSSQDAMTSIAWVANMSGLPAISIPCGKSRNGLPIALTLMGSNDEEVRILKMAARYQDETNWHRLKPDL